MSSSSEDVVIILEDDDDDIASNKRRRVDDLKSSSAVVTANNNINDGDIEFLEQTCDGCGKNKAQEDGVLLKLVSCGHHVHYSCCSAEHEQNKKRKSSSTSEDLACPQCSVDLDWSDHAHALHDRQEYLAYGSRTLSAEDKQLQEIVQALIATWKRQVSSTSTTTKTTKKQQQTSKAKQQQHSSAWAGGTGYGGQVNEKVNTAAIEKSRQAQRKSDETVTASVRSVLAGLQALHTPLRPSTEFLLKDLVPLLSAFFLNGPADVASRSDLYAALLTLAELLAARVCLVPLLVQDQDQQEMVLVRVARLAEGLRETAEEGGGQQLAVQADRIKRLALESLGKHPHFSSAAQVERITTAVQAGRSLWRQRSADADRLARSASATQPELERAYKSTLQSLQFRAISLVDLCTSGLAAHSYCRKDAGSGTIVIGPHRVQGGGYVLAAASAATSASSGSAERMKRIRKELASLKSSMPLEWNSSIFCAVDDTRPDVLQFLIIGPEGTPYQNGCFVFDCFVPVQFPQVPPHISIQTTGGGQVRFNPNLYKDGKVCLSLLGTWSGPGWDPKNSTLLQVLVSIQSLIMVSDPYFNEPGFEASMGTPQGKFASDVYNANIRYHTMRLGMTQMMQSPPYAFAQIVKTHFALKKREITQQVAKWKDEHEATMRSIAMSTASSGASHLLQIVSSGGGGIADVAKFAHECANVTTALMAKAAATSSSSSSSSRAEHTVILDDEEVDDDDDYLDMLIDGAEDDEDVVVDLT